MRTLLPENKNPCTAVLLHKHINTHGHLVCPQGPSVPKDARGPSAQEKLQFLLTLGTEELHAASQEQDETWRHSQSCCLPTADSTEHMEQPWEAGRQHRPETGTNEMFNNSLTTSHMHGELEGPS